MEGTDHICVRICVCFFTFLFHVHIVIMCICGLLYRRESERRNHSLARHADILAAVETRLSLLNMTFMKYVDSNLCCFIPGKVQSRHRFQLCQKCFSLLIVMMHLQFVLLFVYSVAGNHMELSNQNECTSC